MSPEYYNSRNQETYQVELISHKNSSKGRSQKQRTRLGGKKKKWERSGLLPHLPSEPHSAPMPASPLLGGVEYPVQMLLSNSAGPVINAANGLLAIYFRKAGGKGRPLPCSGSSGLHYTTIPASALQCSFKRHIAWPPCKWAVRKSGSPQKGSKQFEMGLESSKDSSSLTWLVTE